MSLLKKIKRNKKPKVTVKDLTDLILNINQLKQKELLYTTEHGVFYTYRAIVESGNHPEVFCKNLYIYARSAKLISKSQTLKIIDVLDKTLIASATSTQVKLH